jgi:diaminopimelate epimerase
MLFTKMHGAGNDFIVINDIDDRYKNLGSMSKIMCDRHFGIGADGLMIVKKSSAADYFMLLYNSDGSQAEMCGNGIRCFAKFLYDNGLINKKTVSVETPDGIKHIEINIGQDLTFNARVNMGKPELNPRLIPANFNTDRVVNMPVSINGQEYSITSMLMGVPHTVIFADDVNDEEAVRTGKLIGESIYFPRKSNVNFVKVKNSGEIYVKTMERGAGLTLACGTGTCASLVACVLNNLTGREVRAHLPGGDISVSWEEDGSIYMYGPAVTVYQGQYEL